MIFILRTGILALLLMPLSFLASGQEVVATSGDNFSAGDLAISWTLGEAVIETFENGQLVLTQGFHQPSLMITSVEGTVGKTMVSVFPNPVLNAITISLPQADRSRFTAVLFDSSGRQLKTKRLLDEDEALSFEGMTSGLYLLVVYREQSVLQSFKIVKK